ncbi:MAG: tetratricopeptide repeat protein [Planctomycetes bacterium]|nr:tetratricopeptide repeat protein [Planctomycetota bacterium]
MVQPTRQRGLVLLALFLSGLAGLMHEVVWAKLLANLTGSTAKAHAVVLAVFMGGLALGAVLFGRGSDKRDRPLRVYVWLEVLIGLYCIALPFLTQGAGALYEGLAAATFEQPGLKLALRLVLSLVVVLAPAVMMGGTLPVLARYLIDEVAQTRKAVASLYALNNIGAVLGSGVAGFYLLPQLGIWSALAVASSMNFLAAGLVWLADARGAGTPKEVAAQASESGPQYTAGQFRATLWALALSGFAAMGYEIVFLRVIGLGFGSSNNSFTVMLMCFITGIGIGSWIVSVVDIKRPLWWLAASQVAVLLSLLAITPVIERLPYFISSMRTELLVFEDPTQPLLPSGEVPGGYELFLAGQAAYCFLMLLLPTICIGFGFPLVSQIQARSAARIGGTVGNTYAWNTVGNVLGVIVTSLVLMPMLGMDGAFHMNLALNAVAIALLLVAAADAAFVLRVTAAVATVAGMVAYSVQGFLEVRGERVASWARTIRQSEGHLRLRKGPPADADALLLSRHAASNFEWWKKTHLRDPDPRVDGWDDFGLWEDADASVMGVRRERLAAIYINSKGDASTGPLDMITFLLSGHIPMFFLPKQDGDKANVMVIGHGSGVTTGAISLYDEVERIDVVEISKAVLDADKLFTAANHGVLENPKTHVYLDDARTFLRTVPRKYDLIVSQPSNPWIAGIGSLFTVDFFEDCRDRLEQGGIMMVWFHHYEQSNETIQLITRTIHEVFPHVQCFLTFESDTIGLASMEPLPVDFAAMESLFDRPQIRSDLARVGVYNLSGLLAYHGANPAHFAALVGQGPLNTDDHQRLEYLGARNMFLGRNANLLEVDPGFDLQGDGLTDSLLDRYLLWREAQGEPLHQPEFQATLASVENILTRDHRMAQSLRSRAPRATDTSSASRPARGKQVALGELGFSEAFNWAQIVQATSGLEAALAYLEQAVRKEPTNSGASITLAQAYDKLGRSEDCINTLLAVMNAGTTRTDPKLALARLAMRAERFDEARRMLEELVQVEENGDALYLLGELVGRNGDIGAAGEYFRRTILRDPKLRHWQATMNYTQVLRMQAQNLPASDIAGKRRLLEQARSEVRYALYHNPLVADLTQQLATIEVDLARLNTPN